MLIIPRPVNAELKINYPQNITVEPGELKIIKVSIENLATTKQTINPDLELPNNWKLIIPLNKVTIASKEKKNINILLQSPKMIRSSVYSLNLLMKTQNKNYKIQIPVKIKEIYKTEVKVVKAPKFIEKEFEIKLKLINNGNISRHFKIINNNTLAIDKSNIFLNSFESEIITLKGRIKEPSEEEIRLNIRAKDKLNKIITLFNDTVTILASDRKFKNYDSSLNYRVVKEKGKTKEYWKLKTSLKKKKILEIGTGSGYQTAILLEMGAKVYSIERYRELYLKAKALLNEMGYHPYLFYGDGHKGQQAYAPYDKIIITAGAAEVPRPLLDQLKIGGIIVVPLGGKAGQEMTVIKKTGENETEEYNYGSFIFVPMVKGKDTNNNNH